MHPHTIPGKLLVLVGPTAVGKTSLSLRLARTFDGEIVSADSRLFYRGMDIGTAKPTVLERADVPHHLIDFCDPDQTLTLAQYQRLAYETINGILDRHKLPILVGGTGQYVMALIQGWGIPEVAPDPALRRQLEALGGAELARWLQHLDPEAARNIDHRNIRRVVRALEVTLTVGRPISEIQRKTAPSYDICIIGLYRDRLNLYQRIDRRVDQMLANGLLDEVSELKDMGYSPELPAMSGLGYRQILSSLSGEIDMDEAIERIKFETHRFARQQATWFRRNDPRIEWFDADALDHWSNIQVHVRQWLGVGKDPLGAK